MKKKIAFILVLTFLFLTFTSCAGIGKSKIRIGMILAAEESDPYALLHIEAVKKMAAEIKLKENQLVIKSNVDQESSYKSITHLIEEKCNLIFSVGSGFEDYMVQAATENSKVNFCVCGGTQAATAEIANLHAYGFKEFESRYVAGVAAGLKLQDMIDNGEITAASAKIGYVGSVRGAENVSAYSAFFLGARSACPDAVMQVQYAGKTNDPKMEEIAAKALIANGMVLLSQQSPSNGLAKLCEKNGKYYVGCGGAVDGDAPNTAIASVLLDWTETYKYPVECLLSKKQIPAQWSVGAGAKDRFLTNLNEKVFSNKEAYDAAVKAIDQAETDLISGALHVFDTEKFTYNGEKVTTTLRAQEAQEKPPEGENRLNPFAGEVEYISPKGYFMEFEIDVLPRFEIPIDGLRVVN